MDNLKSNRFYYVVKYWLLVVLNKLCSVINCCLIIFLNDNFQKTVKISKYSSFKNLKKNCTGWDLNLAWSLDQYSNRSSTEPKNSNFSNTLYFKNFWTVIIWIFFSCYFWNILLDCSTFLQYNRNNSIFCLFHELHCTSLINQFQSIN